MIAEIEEPKMMLWKLYHSPKIRLFILSYGLFALHVTPAFAAPMFTVTPDRNTTQIFEGNGASIAFTITNTGNTAFTVSDVRLVNNSVKDSIKFIDNDLFDEVYNVFLQNPKNCIGIKITSEGTCVFREFVQTRDTFPELSDKNFGRWFVENVVQVDEEI